MEKVCKKCGHNKPLGEYFKNKNNTDGYLGSCKVCVKASNKKYYEKNKEVILKQVKEYCKSNRAEISARRKKYRENNEEEIRQSKREYYERNRDRLIRKAKAWGEKNKDKQALIFRNHANRRRLVEKDGVSTRELKQFLDSQPKICSYCGEWCESSYEIDHIDPVSKGGKHQLENIAISCRTCNRSKSNKFLVNFMAIKNGGKKDVSIFPVTIELYDDNEQYDSKII